MGEKLKKFFYRLNPPSLPVQERLFRLIMSVGLFALGIGIISGLVSGEDTINTLALCGAFLLLAGITKKYSLVRSLRVCSFCLS